MARAVIALLRGVALMALLVSSSWAIVPKDAAPDGIRLKDLGKLGGWRENAVVGYGLVTGLAGTGDSPRNQATRQSIANLLQHFDLKLTPDQVTSRNVAAVMVTASLPPFAQRGDTLDVTVTSMGDARSLLGGSLLLAPLKGPDGRVYALAQGAISVGGYKYDMNGNVVQKNHPTVGVIPSGAAIEVPLTADVVDRDNKLVFVLARPDYTTANRIAAAINHQLGDGTARARTAADVEIKPAQAQIDDLVAFMTSIENLSVEPDRRARVVINERTGVVVSGGDVRISKVSISHGDLKVSIVTDNTVSQPAFVRQTDASVRTEVVSNSRVDVKESTSTQFIAPTHNTISDLVQALAKLKTSTRDIISILQAVKAAGALHADLIIQ
ncbi:MAG TPA: flagellar basal body P-ring protein FlgI [Burkholderiaceae bacterium]|nr:flagellar basal body P-ring protein FlgI [Burkholderiaceae bacterium]